MIDQYDGFLNMTNEEAAKIISDNMCNNYRASARGNGKTITRLRINMALTKAIDALMMTAEPNMQRPRMDLSIDQLINKKYTDTINDVIAGGLSPLQIDKLNYVGTPNIMTGDDIRKAIDKGLEEDYLDE